MALPVRQARTGVGRVMWGSCGIRKGSRGTDLQTYRNLFITFLLIGLWHGADWTFVLYGCFHAVGMCVNRFIRVNSVSRMAIALTTRM